MKCYWILILQKITLIRNDISFKHFYSNLVSQRTAAAVSKSISFSWLGGHFRTTFLGRDAASGGGRRGVRASGWETLLYFNKVFLCTQHGNLIILKAGSQSLSCLYPFLLFLLSLSLTTSPLSLPLFLSLSPSLPHSFTPSQQKIST